jgi:acetyl esterase/lipase
MTTRITPSLLALSLVLLASARFAAAESPADVAFDKDVIYGKAGGTDLKLDLSRPKKPAGGKLPCVVVIHGGGWGAGNKQQHDDLTWQFASRGYVAATIGYRLAPAHQFPAQVHDVKCAVRYLRAHADKYGLDPDRIGAIGFSAGAHLSMMLGTTTAAEGLEGDGGWADQSSRVQAVVSFFGPTDLAADDIPPVVIDILTRFIGGTKREKPEAFRKASPLTHVSPGDAPMLLFQGTKDPLVPHTQAYPMLEAMTKHNIPGRIELLIGAGHGWVGNELSRTAAESFAFFDEYLKPKPAPAGAPSGAAGR